MVNYIPDRLSIMTYLSQFYQALVAPKTKGTATISFMNIFRHLTALSGTGFLRAAGRCSFTISSNNNKAVEIIVLTVKKSVLYTHVKKTYTETSNENKNRQRQ